MLRHPSFAQKPTLHQGFTLMEMLLVLVIIGIMAGIALPRYTGMIAHFHATSAATRIATDLSLAKKRARMIGSSQTVAFDVIGDDYTLPGMPDLDRTNQAYTVDLKQEPYRAAIIAADFGGNADVVFDGYGNPDTGGSVIIQVGSAQTTVTLDGATGNAAVK